MPKSATLGEVLQHYANDAAEKDVRVVFLKQLIGEDILYRVAVGDVFDEGTSPEWLEKEIDLNDCRDFSEDMVWPVLG